MSVRTSIAWLKSYTFYFKTTLPIGDHSFIDCSNFLVIKEMWNTNYVVLRKGRTGKLSSPRSTGAQKSALCARNSHTPLTMIQLGLCCGLKIVTLLCTNTNTHTHTHTHTPHC
jgi:hypothetical protein